ncbi:MAG: putative anti-sigma factor antagonist BtrV [Syntrophorhabdus sp. PtaB.Bin047]|jgi:anti-anti-sigma factor|nr:MAG: putative anti-sigma factor antagonist BtrV [Syntrophorhabdus sp. PtaB.Bin047]
MEITRRKEKDVSIVAVSGRIDAITAPDFEKSLDELIAAGDRVILIDLTALGYISSAGLRSILSSAKKLKALSGEILFTGLQGPVEEVFQISGFKSIFKIFPTEAEALGSM